MLGVYLGAGSTVTKGLYHFEGNSNDSSGNAKNGTDANITYSLDNGKLGQGASCNTTTGGITIPSNTFGTIGTGNFVVSMRFYPLAPDTGKYPALFLSISVTSPFPGPTILFDPLNVIGGGNSIDVRLYGGGDQYVTTPSASSLYGAWHNIVFTRVSGVCYCYIDGFLVKQFNDNANLPPADLATIFSRASDPQYQPTGAKGDEFILETSGWTQQTTQKYYTYSKGRFGIL